MKNNYRDQLLEGRRALAHLIHVWHERNGWSHRVLPAFAECLDLARLHNSQISNLRNGKLISPSPEVFLALGQSNQFLHAGLEKIRERLADVHPELLKVLLESSASLLNNDGQPLHAGEFFEIFIGIMPLPKGFDWFIDEDEAAQLSEALSDYLCNGKTWRQCRDDVMTAYPVKKVLRRERFAEVMAGIRDYSAEELDGELLNLYATQEVINGSVNNGVTGFLSELRTLARNCKK